MGPIIHRNAIDNKNYTNQTNDSLVKNMCFFVTNVRHNVICAVSQKGYI